jgi:subtilisin-like proprotein convertase family protein
MTMKSILRIVMAGALVAAVLPALASAQLSNKFDVPLSGEAAIKSWPFYYWSYFNGCESSGIGGGLAWRFRGNVSPAENFDKAFGLPLTADKLAKIDAFGKCAYAAKKECVGGHRVDTKCLEKSSVRSAHAACQRPVVDTATAHEVVNQGCGVLGADKWWGICHGAAGAGVLFAEPVKDVVYNGVTFRAKDVQGILSALSTSTEMAPFGWKGCRNDGEYTRISTNCPSKEYAANDVTPRDYHAYMAYFLGTLKKGVVADVSTGPEVWNQDTDGFATTCSEGGNAGCSAGAKTYTCRTWFRYANDVWTEEVDNGRHAPHLFTKRNLSYGLCVRNGIVEGDGKWFHDPNVDKDALQPDFLWAPKGIDPSDGSNPFITAKYNEFIEKVAKPSAGIGSTPPVTPTNERSFTKTPNLAIPDNKPAGVYTTGLTVGTSGKKFTSFTVCPKITHTYRGDLKIAIVHGTGTSRVTETIWDNAGGSEDNIDQCLSSAALVGRSAGRTFKLWLADTAGGDTGTLVSYTVKYTQK